MARAKLSEFKAKQILTRALGIPFTGYEITSENIHKVVTINSGDKNNQTYVVKVDQGVKGRFKKGLVAIDKPIEQIPSIIKKWEQNGYKQFYLEPFINHLTQEEKYLSIERTRDGFKILFSQIGGINIEEHPESIQEIVLPYENKSGEDVQKIIHHLSLHEKSFTSMLKAFDDNYFAFLEINPLLINADRIILLDAAVEVDSSAEFFLSDGSWTSRDFNDYSSSTKTQEEKVVADLARHSTAAFNLTLLNPNSNLFMLLSGGGASIVLADEAFNQGFGNIIANYGESSGSPTTEESYLYSKQLISLLKKSTAPKKSLLIAGGVANFTDVRKTFQGVIQALEEEKTNLQKLGVKIFVRRGGPHQAEGLNLMRDFLQKNNLFGEVAGPEMILTGIVDKTLNFIQE